MSRLSMCFVAESIGLGDAVVALIGCTAVFHQGFINFLTVGSLKFCASAVTADFNVL